MAQPKNTRRRGKELEEAILSAAWQELQRVGYQALTIQEIANAAGTNKNTLYRHWPTKAVLVINAFSRFGPTIDFTIPDTGTLRGDLLAVFDYFARALTLLSTGKMSGLLIDRLHDLTLDRVMSSVGEHEADSRFTTLMHTVLTHAAARGEVELARVDAELLNLPLVLLVAQLLTQGELPAQTSRHLVDDVLLPVYMYTARV